jgi:hypothetical protein
MVDSTDTARGVVSMDFLDESVATRWSRKGGGGTTDRATLEWRYLQTTALAANYDGSDAETRAIERGGILESR